MLAGSLPWLGWGLLVLIAATVAVRWAASVAVGPIHPPLGPERWATFQADANRVDTVFVGSSRIMRHIEPAVIDRVMGEAGSPTFSFNAGMPAASLLESWHTLERMLAAGAPIRTVVLEPNDLNVDPENRRAARVVSLHDPGFLKRHLRNAQRVDRDKQDKQDHQRRRAKRRAERGRRVRIPPELSFSESWAFTLTAIEAGWLNVSNKGRLARAFFPPIDRHPVPRDVQGFRPLDGRPIRRGLRKNHREFKRIRRFVPRLRRSRRRTQQRSFGDNPVLLDHVAELVMWLRERDIEVVFISPPNGLKRDSSYEAWRAHREGWLPDVPFLHYNHPGDTPELLHKKLWFDEGHLNAAGARVFSRIVARDLRDLRNQRTRRRDGSRR